MVKQRGGSGLGGVATAAWLMGDELSEEEAIDAIPL